MRYKQIKILTASIMIVFTVIFCIGFSVVKVDANSAKQPTLTLSQENSDETVRFEACNMLPGDSVKRKYCMEVCYTESVKLRFRVNVKEDDEVLAEVLKCSVVVQDGKELYNGLMREMPSELVYELVSEKTTKQDVVYTINVYLDTSVGNEYQAKSLTADFFWWVEETENLTPNPDTSSSTGITFLVTICVSILMAAITIVVQRNKADETNDGISKKKSVIIRGLSLLIVIATCSCAVVLALNKSEVVVNDNKFTTGTIAINLNDGNPIIGNGITTLEPGATFPSKFFVENTGNNDAYYRIRFENINGDMEEVIHIAIKENDDVLYSGPMSNLLFGETEFPWEYIEAGEKIYLNISITLSENYGNEVSNRMIEFDAYADAIQTAAFTGK